jgi:enterochelin esterase family protein
MLKLFDTHRLHPASLKAAVLSILTLTLLVGDVFPGHGQDSTGTIQHLTLESQILADAGYEAERGINVYLPPGYESSEENYPVLYMIHGHTANEHIFLSQSNLIGMTRPMNVLYENRLADGEAVPMIIVFPNVNRTEDPTTDKPHEDHIAQEVVAFVDENYRTLTDRANRLIGGHSRGAADAITISLEYPELFSLVGSLATGPVQRFGDLPRELITSHDQDETPLNLFVLVGQTDNLVILGKEIREWNDELDALLTTTDISYEYVEIFGDHLSILTRGINMMLQHFAVQIVLLP